MYKNILIPTDGSELANKAVTHGMCFAHEIGARVTVLMVTEPFAILSGAPEISAPEMLECAEAKYARRIAERVGPVLEAAADQARQAGVPCEIVHLEHAYPYQAIIDAAASRGCDLILMASHGRRGISALVLGSQTLKVLTHSRTPVLVYR